MDYRSTATRRFIDLASASLASKTRLTRLNRVAGRFLRRKMAAQNGALLRTAISSDDTFRRVASDGRQFFERQLFSLTLRSRVFFFFSFFSLFYSYLYLTPVHKFTDERRHAYSLKKRFNYTGNNTCCQLGRLVVWCYMVIKLCMLHSCKLHSYNMYKYVT